MLNRGEAAVGEAGGEPVMALYYEEDDERCERKMRWNKRRFRREEGMGRSSARSRRRLAIYEYL